MSNAVMHGPFLVCATLLSFLLPISAVFTPASLGVSTATYWEDAPCAINNADFEDGTYYPRFWQSDDCYSFTGIAPDVGRMAAITFIKGTSTPLPEFCGDNCTYRVALNSIAYKCDENIQLPPGQMTNGPDTWTFWNATPDDRVSMPNTPIYVGWTTGSLSVYSGPTLGANGSAYCVPMNASYEFAVQTLNGVQTVSYNVTTFDPLANFHAVPGPSPCAVYPGQYVEPALSGQASSIAYAVQKVLLGSLSVTWAGTHQVWDDNATVRFAPFLTMTSPGTDFFVWGDVIKQIEETPAIVTATLLNMGYGRTQNSTCTYIHSDVVYKYDPANLWGPYGVAIFIVTLFLVFGVYVLLRFNPDDLTTSFVDTVSITRDLKMDSFAKKCDEQDELEPVPPPKRFRLGMMSGGYMGYGTEQDF